MDRGVGGLGAMQHRRGRRRVLLRALVGRNRFIAPISRAPPRTFRSRASAYAERRNKAIAPYDPHLVSFNFVNPLICRVASTKFRLSTIRAVLGSGRAQTL